MIQMLTSVIGQRGVDAMAFLLAFVLTALTDSIFRDKLPHDHGRAFAVNGELSKGKARGSGLIFVLCIALVSLAFLPFHHVLGFMVDLLWCSFLGYANIYLRDRTPATIIETSRRFQPELVVAVPLLANNLCSSLRKQVAKESRTKRAWFASAKNLSLNLQRIAPEAGLWFAEKILFRRITKNLLGTEVKCIILGGSHTPQEQLKLLNALGYYTVCGFGMTETAVTSVEMSKRLKWASRCAA